MTGERELEWNSYSLKAIKTNESLLYSINLITFVLLSVVTSWLVLQPTASRIKEQNDKITQY